MIKICQITFTLFIFIYFCCVSRIVAEGTILVQSTTSTRNSGLYDVLLPKFQSITGMQVNVVAVGTGQAIRNAMNCEGDVLIVHSKASEEKFVAEGFGVKRLDLMYNDFVILGPRADPARVKLAVTVENALSRISQGGYKFVSRGDDSGTHKRETELWIAAGMNPKPFSGHWYIEVGAGMGSALNIAAEINGYILADRATWIAFRNKRDLSIVFENDEKLFNQYGVIKVNPKKCPNTNIDGAEMFVNWLTSKSGQDEIRNYKKSGIQLFYPNSKHQ